MGVIESLYETTVNINRIRSMARYECPITVKRNKNGITTYQEISSGKLVPGDIVIVPD